MLIEFTVGNFRSFKEPATLSMVATKLVSQDRSLDENSIYELPKGPRLLKSAAIYGANASGKSNLIAALQFMRECVIGFARVHSAGSIWVQPFRLSASTIYEPSHFEIVFIAEGRQYRYGFDIDQNRVHREWLYHVPTIREARLFERERDDFTLSDAFREGRGLEDKTRSDALFLSVAAQFNGRLSKAILTWFLITHVSSGLDDADARFVTLSLYRDPTKLREVVALVRALDLSIEDVHVESDSAKLEVPPTPPAAIRIGEKPTSYSDAYRVSTVHRAYDAGGNPSTPQMFDLDRDESEGTRKLFFLAGPVLFALKAGAPIIVDELDARLHPIVTQKLVDLFNSPETNPHGAQLIFTTQDTNLLDNRLLRRDQIWFTEKDRFGATHLYSLAEFQGVRNDASFEKDYVRGRYGAIPFLGDLGRLVGEGNGQTTD